MIIVPLTSLSIVSGIAQFENPKTLKSIGDRIFVYYAITAILTTRISLVIVFLI
ncbi:cation:dicarboxylate symporter family transporter [Bacillus cereus]|uniref:cation:dicarboxylate symporter family transporter n=1 Tax=Bacillus cereus TaxID=1396 RepID=UPI0020D20187